MNRCALLLVLLAGCAPTPPVRAALQGDLATLRSAIATARESGQLDRDGVVELARAVGQRELTSAQGTAGAARVRALRGCSRPLRTTMERRARATDEVAAELSLILLETHAVEATPLLDRHARSPEGAWRAVAARAATRPFETDLRKSFYVDGDQRVRREAFTTAREAHDARELDVLLEAARVDPDPQSQSGAVRAVGAIGGERAVLALKDLWAQADESLRLAIVDAWAAQGSFSTGGGRELELASDGAGLAAVSAAAALSRASGPESATANAHLRQTITGGTDDEKRLAMSVAPLSPEIQAALLDVTQHGSPELRVLAWARLSNVHDRRPAALKALRDVLQGKANSDADLRARDAALSGLALAGDKSAQPPLLALLRSLDRTRRWRAARSLVMLGDYVGAASALADDDADVRSGVACAILAQAAARP